MKLMIVQRAFRQHRRRGYTLIEMLISAVLVAALMSSAWGVMSLYNDLLLAGRKKTSQQQLVRSLFQLFEEDLAALNIAKRPSEHSSTGSPFSSTEPIHSTVGTSENSEDVQPWDVSVIGTSASMRLTIRVHQPPVASTQTVADALNELGGGSAANSSGANGEKDPESLTYAPEFQTVIYQFQIPSAADGIGQLQSGLYRVQADSLELQEFLSRRSTLEKSMSQDAVGLDANTLQQLHAEANPEGNQEVDSQRSMQTVAFMRVPEIVFGRFEYFDGVNWLDEWNDGEESIPRAIRVSTNVLNPQQMAELQFTSESQSTSGRQADDGTTADGFGRNTTVPAFVGKTFRRSFVLNAQETGSQLPADPFAQHARSFQQ